MRFFEFVIEWEKCIQKNPSWRRGQAAFNALLFFDEDIAESVRGSDIDPFYLDERLPAFLGALHERLIRRYA